VDDVASTRGVLGDVIVVVQDKPITRGVINNVARTRDVVGDISATASASHASLDAVNTAFFSFLRGERKVALGTPCLNLLLSLREAGAAQ